MLNVSRLLKFLLSNVYDFSKIKIKRLFFYYLATELVRIKEKELLYEKGVGSERQSSSIM